LQEHEKRASHSHHGVKTLRSNQTRQWRSHLLYLHLNVACNISREVAQPLRDVDAVADFGQ